MTAVPGWDTSSVLSVASSQLTYTTKSSYCTNVIPGDATTRYAEERKLRKSATVYSGYPSTYEFRPPTPYQRTVQVSKYPVGTIKGYIDGTVGMVCNNIYRQGVQSYVGPLNCNRAALYPAGTNIPYNGTLFTNTNNALLLSLKDEGSASLGLALLERKQTENLFIKTIKTITKQELDYRKFKPREWLKTSKAFAARDRLASRGRLDWNPNRPKSPGLLKRPLTKREKRLIAVPRSYLEMQYGWKPLIQDVQDSLKAVDFAQAGNLYHFSKRSRKSITDSTERVFMSNYVAGVGGVQKGTRRFRCQFRVDWSISTDVLPPLAALGLTNPYALLWERIPYSFIVDWALPIGDWLNTFDATLGKVFKAGCVTQSLRDEAITFTAYSPIKVYKPDGYWYNYWFEPSSPPLWSAFQMDRTVLTSFPTPIPPAFKNPCSPTHVANALSLLVTAFTGGVPTAARR